jgi:hypothetical protein
MEPHSIYFPDPEEIQPLAVAFAQMMFAHAAFERQVRELQNTITGISGFGERPSSQWSTPTRAGRMAKLIVKHRGWIPEAQAINNVLTTAVRPCLDRNLLAHGEWWRFGDILNLVRTASNYSACPSVEVDSRVCPCWGRTYVSHSLCSRRSDPFRDLLRLGVRAFNRPSNVHRDCSAHPRLFRNCDLVPSNYSVIQAALRTVPGLIDEQSAPGHDCISVL